MRKDCNDLQDFDVGSLCQPQIPELDIFFEDDENVLSKEVKQADDDSEGNDSKGGEGERSDYEGGEREGSEQESIDEESGSKALEDINLETYTQDKMVLGYQLLNEDGSGSQLAVNRMAIVFQKGRLWSKEMIGNVKLALGDLFTCKEDLLKVMREYYIQEGVSFKKLRNDRKRYTQKCSNSICTFRIHASVLVDNITWIIRSITGSHVCPVAKENKMANSRWVVSHLLEDFRRFIKEIIEGKHNEGYMVLPQYGVFRMKVYARYNHEEYMEQFKERNPEFVYFINWTDQGPGKNLTFKRCMICIGSTISAFKEHCKPLIGIDACFLKGPYKGVLMTTMELDGNNGQFPLAYRLTSCENEEEWSFFIHGVIVALEARRIALNIPSCLIDTRIKFDEALKLDENTNNFVESFNNAIMKYRGRPVYNMLEEIRKIVGSRFDRRFQLAISGLPCKYAARCILRMNQKLEDYYAHWFLVEKYRKFYDEIIHPIPDSCMWGGD
ncbi:hypothetical protein Cgig2_022586 [Carnegiea gigantea]|uniref:Transposase MuDR plant domain-containing protein n=1 Tax=Carnegiea gigantea TaxID=171969 RepID=A0A9Q1QKM3_9CARY|nr:hypothetical protein Cgig2_022586 [Carnegiea gigantea]